MYYISSGEQTKMYTLRTRYIEELRGIAIERDYYIRNLSTNPDKALQVARDLGYDVSKKPEFTLEEIRRQKSEEQAKRYEEQRIAEERERVLKENRMIDDIKNYRFPFGKYKNQNFASVPEDYIQYWLSVELGEHDTVLHALVSVLASLFPEIVERIKRSSGNGEYFGEIKKRYQNLKGEIVKVTGFDGFYGWSNVYNIILENGELAVYMGSAYIGYDDNGFVPAKVGDKIKFAGTVKNHSEYDGKAQTKLARLTIKEMNGVKIKKGERVD